MIILLLTNYKIFSQTAKHWSDAYNLEWNTQSKNASESMPCGGGSIGLNVWVENDEILFYIGKSDAFDENNGLLKLGRFRLNLNPNPFKNEFKQELKIYDGFVKISGKTDKQTTDVMIWVDVFRPVIHVEVKSSVPIISEASFESWRASDYKLREGENFQNSYKWTPFDTVYTYKDNIDFQQNNILFFHRNKSNTVFDVTVNQQGLQDVKNQMFNPLKNNTFGGLISAKNMKPAGKINGKYVDTEFSAWKLKSISPAKNQEIEIYVNSQQTNTLEEWKNNLEKIVTEAKSNNKTAKNASINWWHNYWDKSYICTQQSDAKEDSKIWQIGRNYQLFRYMLGCNAFGTSPTKFNGGMFTVDPYFTDNNKHYTADYRNWCGGTMTAQNQRLVYFPMLKTGDFEMMKPQFDFYLKALRNAELRSEVYWKHKGACFTEQIESFGLPNSTEYGWGRSSNYDKGMENNAWLEYLWDTSLEFCYMILETNRFAGKDITEYVPLIKSCLTFFDEHYQYLAKTRGTNALNEEGKLIIYPGSGAETYKMAYNPSSTIAALKTVLKSLLALPEKYLKAEERKNWEAMLKRIPEIPYRQIEGHTCISPAITWERVQNVESPQLYPVFPWGIFGVGKPGLDTALNTWKYDKKVIEFRSHVGWKQDNIWAARLGLTKEAAELAIKKLENSGRRFPAFWGPGFDWTPDHNWGGSAMIGLQEMLMQTTDDKIYLLPAWPSEWDVDFKLFAPQQTTLEVSVKNGKIVLLKILPESRKKDLIINKEFTK